MRNKHIWVLLALTAAVSLVALCTYQDWTHIELNAKQVALMYWKERVAGFLVVVLLLIKMVLEEE